MDKSVSKLITQYEKAIRDFRLFRLKARGSNKALASSLLARASIKKKVCKQLLYQLNNKCWKGNMVRIKFSVTEPFKYEIYEVTFTDITPDEAAKLIGLKFPKYHIIESINIPTQLKKVGL